MLCVAEVCRRTETETPAGVKVDSVLGIYLTLCIWKPHFAIFRHVAMPCGSKWLPENQVICPFRHQKKSPTRLTAGPVSSERRALPEEIMPALGSVKMPPCPIPTTTMPHILPPFLLPRAGYTQPDILG